MSSSALRETHALATSAREFSWLVEHSDDFSAALSKRAERQDDMAEGEPTSGLVESYLQGKKCIAFRRAEKFTLSETVQDGFTIHAFQGFRAANSHLGRSEHEVADYVGACGEQTFMLPQDVQLVQGPDGFIPSLIRLQRFDRGSLALGKPLFAFNAINPGQGINHALSGIENRKMSFRIRFFAIALCQGGGKQIKTATERIETRAEPSIECERQRGLLNSYYNIAVRLRITLADDGIGESPLPFDQALLDQWDLGYGPLDASIRG
jgi:hypothetical protein